MIFFAESSSVSKLCASAFITFELFRIQSDSKFMVHTSYTSVQHTVTIIYYKGISGPLKHKHRKETGKVENGVIGWFCCRQREVDNLLPVNIMHVREHSIHSCVVCCDQTLYVCRKIRKASYVRLCKSLSQSCATNVSGTLSSRIRVGMIQHTVWIILKELTLTPLPFK